MSGSDHVELPIKEFDDSRHGRAWLNWRIEDINQHARWLRMRIDKVKSNSCVSLGEVIVWGLFSGEVQATIMDDNGLRRIDQGKRFNVDIDRKTGIGMGWTACRTIVVTVAPHHDDADSDDLEDISGHRSYRQT
jgi:hypothetical protein